MHQGTARPGGRIGRTGSHPGECGGLGRRYGRGIGAAGDSVAARALTAAAPARGAPYQLAGIGAVMQAIMVSEFGGPEVLQPGEAPRPEPRACDVLVRVIAACAGLGTLRCAAAAGRARFLTSPAGSSPGYVEGDTGADFALDPGAPVYGYPGLTGCYAEYVTCPGEKLAPVPAGLSLIDAAATPIDALTAEQGLTDVLAIAGGRPRADHRRRGRARSFRGADRPHPGCVGHRHGQPAASSVRAPARRGQRHRPHQGRLAGPGP